MIQYNDKRNGIKLFIVVGIFSKRVVMYIKKG